MNCILRHLSNDSSMMHWNIIISLSLCRFRLTHNFNQHFQAAPILSVRTFFYDYYTTSLHAYIYICILWPIPIQPHKRADGQLNYTELGVSCSQWYFDLYRCVKLARTIAIIRRILRIFAPMPGLNLSKSKYLPPHIESQYRAHIDGSPLWKRF